MMVFEQAWTIVKDVDFKIPRPGDVPKYLDQDANLAFRGSRIPDWWAFENPDGQRPDINPVTGEQWENPITDPLTGELWPNPDDFWDSIRFEIERKQGNRVVKPYMDYEVGDFGEALPEGIKSKKYFTPEPGIRDLLSELERASMVRGVMDAGIVDRKEISDALDEKEFADGRGTFHLGPSWKRTKRGNFMTNRIGGKDLDDECSMSEW